MPTLASTTSSPQPCATREGICLDDVPETFRATLLADAAPHLASGLLLHEDNRLHLSRAGILVSNTVMSDLMRV
jgi:oxygen-independent coproporphyrinogen-3 oxidase